MNSGCGCLIPPTNFANSLKKTGPSSSLKDSNPDREPYLYLSTQGRRSGLPREIEIWFTQRDGRFYLIAEYSTSHWVQNLPVACNWNFQQTKKPEQRMAAPACLCVAHAASGDQGLHKVLAQRGLDLIVPVAERGKEVRFQNFLDLEEHLALIALYVLLLRPQGDGDHLLILDLREEGQHLQEPSLLLQNGQNLVAYYLDKLFFLFPLRNKFNNARKHGGFSFSFI